MQFSFADTGAAKRQRLGGFGGFGGFGGLGDHRVSPGIQRAVDASIPNVQV